MTRRAGRTRRALSPKAGPGSPCPSSPLLQQVRPPEESCSSFRQEPLSGGGAGGGPRCPRLPLCLWMLDAVNTGMRKAVSQDPGPGQVFTACPTDRSSHPGLTKHHNIPRACRLSKGNLANQLSCKFTRGGQTAYTVRSPYKKAGDRRGRQGLLPGSLLVTLPLPPPCRAASSAAVILP